jgi:cytidyltransferase-like protein
MKQKAIIVSGYFNPIHKGHIEYFQQAKSFGDKLFVIVNNDFQRSLKGSKKFQDENERLLNVENLKLVDKCFIAIDKDRSVCESIKLIYKNHSFEFDFSFANGGDQKNENSPEKLICSKLGIDLIDGLGDKIQSSSWLLSK